MILKDFFNDASLKNTMRIFAHRGGYFPYSSYEYHISNLQFSILSQDNDGIEIDVRFTKDHIPVLHHDPVHNNHLISSINYSETTMIPLKDILEQSKNVHKILLIEIKENPSDHDIRILIELLSNYHWIQKRILSFRQDVLDRFSSFDCVLLISTYLNDWAFIINTKQKYKGIGLSYEIIDNNILSVFREFEIYIFTVNYPIIVPLDDNDYNIITDFPERFLCP